MDTIHVTHPYSNYGECRETTHKLSVGVRAQLSRSGMQAAAMSEPANMEKTTTTESSTQATTLLRTEGAFIITVPGLCRPAGTQVAKS